MIAAPSVKPMPQSLVLNLTTQSTIPAHQTQGVALQQLFFHLIDIVDPELGHVLRRDKENRDYSLSAIQTVSPSLRQLGNPLQGDPLQYVHAQAIAPKTECWWRISFLDDELFDHLIFLWRQFNNEVFPLGDGEVKISQVTANPLKASWANSCSYRDIYEQADANQHSIHLQFVTPTTFKTKNLYTPLPTPDVVFQPLRKRWNRYSGLAFTPNLIDALVPAQFNIRTETVYTRANMSGAITGCVGQISFRIVEGGDPLTAKRLNALADFTRYCPVGSNTLLGMGITRRIRDNVISLRRSS